MLLPPSEESELTERLNYPESFIPQPLWDTHHENPFNWPKKKKWSQFLAGCLVTLLVGLNTTVIATPGFIIAKEFNIDTTNPDIDNTVWPITAWNMGAAIGPLFGIPFLEAFGVKNGYLMTYVLFFLFVIPQALAQNFATMIATRAFAGVFGGILMMALECFIADIWLEARERDLPVTLFVLADFAGIVLGPVLGATFSVLNWRWVFYIQLIIYGTLLPYLLFAIQETRGPVIRARLTKICPYLTNPLSVSNITTTSSSIIDSTSKEYRGGTLTSVAPENPPLKHLIYTATIRAVDMLVTEPIVVAFTLWSAFCFGIVYMCIQSISQIYKTNYNFTDAQCGLLQLSPLLGLILGLLPCNLQNTCYHRQNKNNPTLTASPKPERRLPASILASLLTLSGGLFWYALTTSANPSPPHWLVPTVALVLIGFGVQTIVTAAALYITDVYTTFAGSAISCLAFGENVMAAWLPLAARGLYTKVGFRGASAILGGGAAVLTAAPVALLLWGGRARGASRFLRGR